MVSCVSGHSPSSVQAVSLASTRIPSRSSEASTSPTSSGTEVGISRLSCDIQVPWSVVCQVSPPALYRRTPERLQADRLGIAMPPRPLLRPAARSASLCSPVTYKYHGQLCVRCLPQHSSGLLLSLFRQTILFPRTPHFRSLVRHRGRHLTSLL